MCETFPENEHAYREGWLDRHSGKSISENPYSGEEGVRWELGWFHADAGAEYDGYSLT